MSLHKFYQAIDGDFEAACRRFYNENMLQKFLIRFLDEPCCAELNDALGRHDRDAAIKAVHTLTGTQLWLYTAGKEERSTVASAARQSG